MECHDMWHLNRARRDSSRPIPLNVVAIEAFYSRHDSREAPSMKYMVIIRTAGFKEMKQKRHLLYKLREVYALFWEEHGNNVGFSTLCNLRLVNVLLSRSTAHDMCLCQTHANFISLTTALLLSYNRQWSVENAVCRFEEGCMLSINVQLAKTAQSWRKLCKESKSLVTKCLDGRKQQMTTDWKKTSWLCQLMMLWRWSSMLYQHSYAVCEKVSGGGIPARNRRSSAAKCECKLTLLRTIRVLRIPFTKAAL